MMKQLILRLLLFSVFALIVVVFVIGSMGLVFPKTFSRNIKNKKGDVGHMSTRIKEIKSIDSVDVLVIGSSHAYRGFDPRTFAQAGIKIFVLGSSAQTPIQTEVLVKKYFDRLKPKLVIHEVFPAVFCIDGVESSIDLISNGEIDFGTLRMALRVNNLITYNSLFFNGFKKLVLNDRFQEPTCKNGECYISGGYVQRTEFVKYKGRKRSNPLNWNFRNDQMRAFERTVEFLKNKNCNTILLQTPIVQAFYDSYENNREIDRFFQSFGIPYYNCNSSRIGSNNSLYYDQDHLNTKGVEQFNILALAIIKGRPDWNNPSN